MTYKFQLAMACGGCAKTVTDAVLALDPQAQVRIDLPAKTAQVDSGKTREELARALSAAGYAPA
ncbi:heavy-metal-associated domain-containing protein [uncultured Ramlibacter sp.]|uniref:heavy-metal-associated domain-containing protein n=1 Tax=uncultured Ramlibacter sp. TaxID=260755 RepID=UPI00261363FD|nr:heavy-metal-associated domain-containing protein [uncultured Ramlibacter sp.]